jgi:hypothetical protein
MDAWVKDSKEAFMYLPIRRWRAVAFGVVLALTCSASSSSAGLVPPTASDPQPVDQSEDPSAAQPANGVSVALPVAVESEEPFWFPGAEGAESLAISSVPIVASDMDQASPFPGTQQHPLIPLPGAAWTGMAGLLGLGAVKVLRNLRKFLA